MVEHLYNYTEEEVATFPRTGIWHVEETQKPYHSIVGYDIKMSESSCMSGVEAAEWMCGGVGWFLIPHLEGSGGMKILIKWRAAVDEKEPEMLAIQAEFQCQIP